MSLNSHKNIHSGFVFFLVSFSKIRWLHPSSVFSVHSIECPSCHPEVCAFCSGHLCHSKSTAMCSSSLYFLVNLTGQIYESFQITNFCLSWVLLYFCCFIHFCSFTSLPLLSSGRFAFSHLTPEEDPLCWRQPVRLRLFSNYWPSSIPHISVCRFDVAIWF